MTSGPAAPSGVIAASAAESKDHISTFGTTQTAIDFPPGHEKGFLSKIMVSSNRPDECMPVVTFSCCIAAEDDANTPVAPRRPKDFVKNSRRFVNILIDVFSPESAKCLSNF